MQWEFSGQLARNWRFCGKSVETKPLDIRREKYKEGRGGFFERLMVKYLRFLAAVCAKRAHDILSATAITCGFWRFHRITKSCFHLGRGTEFD
jgi:hypothetical protein